MSSSDEAQANNAAMVEFIEALTELSPCGVKHDRPTDDGDDEESVKKSPKLSVVTARSVGTGTEPVDSKVEDGPTDDTARVPEVEARTESEATEEGETLHHPLQGESSRTFRTSTEPEGEDSSEEESSSSSGTSSSSRTIVARVENLVLNPARLDHPVQGLATVWRVTRTPDDVVVKSESMEGVEDPPTPAEVVVNEEPMVIVDDNQSSQVSCHVP